MKNNILIDNDHKKKRENIYYKILKSYIKVHIIIYQKAITIIVYINYIILYIRIKKCLKEQNVYIHIVGNFMQYSNKQ